MPSRFITTCAADMSRPAAASCDRPRGLSGMSNGALAWLMSTTGTKLQQSIAWMQSAVKVAKCCAQVPLKLRLQCDLLAPATHFDA